MAKQRYTNIVLNPDISHGWIMKKRREDMRKGKSGKTENIKIV